MKRKKTNPLTILIIMTSILFAVSLGALFVIGYGDFSLFLLFDKLMNGEGYDVLKNNTTVEVRMNSLNNAIDYNITDELEERINAYFLLYYSSLGILDSKGFNDAESKLFVMSEGENERDGGQLDYLIEKRKNSNILLTFNSCDVIITYEDAKFADNKVAEVTLTESFSTRFDGLAEKAEFNELFSSTTLSEHYFAFFYTKGLGWQIERHENKSKAGKYLSENFSASKDGLKAEIADYREFDTAEYQANLPSPEYTYNRKVAVKYASDYVGAFQEVRNEKQYAAYPDNGMNYISQCIFAGGIPMDAHGEGPVQWKWYSDELNHEQQSGTQRTGYSNAWVNGNSFYRYINENTGIGIVAGEAPLQYAEPGDVIQFLNKEHDTSLYQCIITGKLGSELLVSANSNDMQNMPLSALGFDEIRVLKIYGYNT